MNGQEALEKGLIDEVTAEGKGAEHGEAFAHKLLASPIAAMIASKKILHAQKTSRTRKHIGNGKRSTSGDAENSRPSGRYSGICGKT